jgi:hypothetical protein
MVAMTTSTNTQLSATPSEKMHHSRDFECTKDLSRVRADEDYGHAAGELDEEADFDSS